MVNVASTPTTQISKTPEAETASKQAELEKVNGAIDLRKKVSRPGQRNTEADSQAKSSERVEVSENLDTATLLRNKVAESLAPLGFQTSELGLTIESEEYNQEVDRLKIEAKIQDLALLQIISTSLDRLQKLGVYKGKKETGIRNINLQVTDEVVQMLAYSRIPLDEAVVFLNKICTNGWRYPDWGIEKKLIRGPEGYRLAEVFSDDERLGPFPEDVPWLMKAFGQKLEDIISNPNNRNPQTAEKIASWAYFIYLSIHPFADGNGRTARALGELVMRKLGIENPEIPGIEENRYGGSEDASVAVYTTRIKRGFSEYYYPPGMGEREWDRTWSRWRFRGDQRIEQIASNIKGYIALTPEDLSTETKITEDLKEVTKVLFRPEKSKIIKRMPKINTDERVTTTLGSLKLAFQTVNQAVNQL